MKKAKKIMNITNLTRMVIALAILLGLIAIYLVLTGSRSQKNITEITENKTIVVVSSGDTLSGLLLTQGLNHNDVHTIDKVLKSDASISTLRAQRDKLEFIRQGIDSPVSKIIVITSPWNQVELTCGDSGNWVCKKIEMK